MGAHVVTARIDARTALRGLAAEASVVPLDEVTARPPEEALAHLLDLNSIVRVADHLSSRRSDTPGGRGRVRSPLRKRIDKKVEELRADVRDAFASPLTGRRAMPDAATILRVARETGALERRDETTLSEAARTLTAQARERFDHQLARMRQRVRWMRTDLTADVRRQGALAAELDALDAVIARALETGTSRTLERLERALDAAYARRIADVLRALPLPPAPSGDDPPPGAPVSPTAPGPTMDAADGPAPADAAGHEAAVRAALDAAVAPDGLLGSHARGLGQLLVALAERELDFLFAWLDASSAPSPSPRTSSPSLDEERAP